MNEIKLPKLKTESQVKTRKKKKIMLLDDDLRKSSGVGGAFRHLSGNRPKPIADEFNQEKNQAIKNGTFDPESGERFPFHEDDLRYKHSEVT